MSSLYWRLEKADHCPTADNLECQLMAMGRPDRSKECFGDGAMTVHRYPAWSLLGDGIRAGLGLFASWGPLLFIDVAPLLWPLLVGLGIVFLLFAGQVLLQSLSTIELSGQGIVIRGPFTKVLRWCELSKLKLSHYASARRSKGWFRLSLRGADDVLKLESTIEGFDRIVAMAREAAESANLTLDPATSDNLATLRRQRDG
jgi:hypothetical protein